MDPSVAVLAVAIAVVAAGVVSGVLTPLVKRVAHRYKWYDLPDSRKLHTGLIPRIGGLAIFLSIILGTGAGAAALAALSLLRPGAAAPLLAAAGAVLIFAVGLFDDFVPLRPRVKLLLQVVVAAIIALGGMRVDAVALPGLGQLDLGLAAVPVTVLWIVGMVNSVNLIDGRDGLAGGIAAFAAVGMGVIALLQGHLLTAVAAMAVFGATCVFLAHNWPPASIFMGDSGSHMFGFTLAVLPLLEIGGIATLHTIMVPVTLMLIPIVDCGAAVLRRVRQGVSLGTADTDHIHFILRDLGLSDRKILLVVYPACAYLTIVAITAALLLREAAFYLMLITWTGVLLAYGTAVAVHTNRRKQQRDAAHRHRAAQRTRPRRA